MRTRNIKNKVVFAAMLVLVLMPALPAQTHPTVFAKGFNNPRGLKFGPNGNLYVAEGGEGGSSSTQGICPQVPAPVGPYTGGFTGRISKVTPNGAVSTVADNLPSSQTSADQGSLVSGVADVAFIGQRSRAVDIAGAYKRYALAANGVSPMAIPGTRGGQYTADGLTHTERGTPTSGIADHHAQLDKRRDKLERFNYGDHWATIEEAGDLAVITWGSLTGTVREAIARAAADGASASLIAPRLLAPVQPERMQAALAGKKRVLVVEQSHGAQFHRYLRAHYDLPGAVRVFNRAGPLPIRADEVRRAIMEWR